MLRQGGRVAATFVIALLVAGVGCRNGDESGPADSSSEPERAAVENVQGRLRVAAYGPDGGPPTVVHRTRFVRGPEYQGVEDVDLRGFLDGRFFYGWNQPTQGHFRIGRRPTTPRWGETELFRAVFRWDGLGLPPDSRIRRAALDFQVEKPVKRDLDVMLYSVLPEFEPGQGGVEENSTSPPKPGEVWWGAARHEERPWSHPGVGFASETHEAADTPATALAQARLPAQGMEFRFTSGELTQYVEARVREGLAPQFLVKVADVQEDERGTWLHVWGVNEGDLRNTRRRPVLDLRWSAEGESAALDRHVILEHGRVLELPPQRRAGARHVAASFEAEEGFEAPTLQVRGIQEGEPGPWQTVLGPIPLPEAWDAWQVRAVAATDPVELGSPFVDGVFDTWVVTAPPEAQTVAWTFVSPSGEIHEVDAAYDGDWHWTASITPWELGRWHYRWSHAFTKRGWESSEGSFDVVALEPGTVARGLDALLERIEREAPESSDRDLSPLAEEFWRLERAALASHTPEAWAAPGGRAIFDRLTAVRVALSDRKVPDVAPLVPMDRERLMEQLQGRP